MEKNSVAITASREWFSLLLKCIGDAVIATDDRCLITFMNPVAEALTGWKETEAKGTDLAEVFKAVNEQTRQSCECPLKQAQRSGVAGTLEKNAILCARDGREIPIEDTAAPLKDGTGRIVGMIMVFRDISERRRAEEAQGALQERLAGILNIAEDAVISMDGNHRIQLFNHGAEKIFGYSAQEILGQPIELLMPLRQREMHRDHVNRFEKSDDIARRMSTRGEISGLRKDGTEFPAEASISKLELKVETVFTIIMRGISERKQVEFELLQAKESAESSNRTKSEFLANMSHEIRTPLNGVIGMTEVLLDTQLTDAQREYTEMIKSSGKALLAIINDILDFSKVEARQLGLEMIEFDLCSVIDEVVKSLSTEAFRKGLELNCQIEPGIPFLVIGDPFRLRQILTNLVGNAVKFTLQGEVSVQARLVQESATEALVWFGISDTGIGIVDEARQRLFKSFSQVDGSTTRKYGGSGLGLAISKQLAELMGGEIGVDSTPGKGSTFGFTVRLGKRPAQEMIQVVGAAESQALRVLIADDNSANRAILRQHAQALGMLPICAEDGRQALELLRTGQQTKEQADLIILDMQLPGLDDMPLARSIMADPILSAIPLVVMATPSQRDQRMKTRRAKRLHYLTKPVSRSQFQECVRASLDLNSVFQKSKGVSTLLNSAPASKSDTLHHGRILIVEDNLMNLKVAVHSLRKLGFHADTAANGREALEKLSKTRYALVLMDCQMPELDGFEATRAIRQKEQVSGEHLPVIALTASAMQSDRERCLEAGMDDYLSKPIEVKRLREVLQRFMPELPGSQIA